MNPKRIAITGANGFLGTHLTTALKERGHTNLFTFSSSQYDLTTERDVVKMYQDSKCDTVIHLAAVVGGIGANRKHPGTFYYKNLMMGALLLEQARINNIDKFVAISTVCSYPKFCKVPFQEKDIWEGYPEETNAPYGIAKKAMLVQAQSYRQEFGLNSIYLLPVNLYGPGDNFNPETSHVIPALIKKCIEARDTNAASIECWGTGKATREFLYVKDAAKAIVLATEQYNKGDPINIGNGQEIPIAMLVQTIAKLCKFTGKIIWNANYPDGQPRRCLDIKLAKQEFGFTATTTLEDGLAATIEWYEKNK